MRRAVQISIMGFAGLSASVPLAFARKPPPAATAEVTGKTITTPSGLQYIDVKIGTGAVPTAGQFVTVHYTGTLKDGKKFDSSRDRGQPFSFQLGKGKVIKGWDEGIATMKVGGRRTLVIPSNLGYAERGFGNLIPPDAELHFDVELLGAL